MCVHMGEDTHIYFLALSAERAWKQCRPCSNKHKGRGQGRKWAREEAEWQGGEGALP